MEKLQPSETADQSNKTGSPDDITGSLKELLYKLTLSNRALIIQNETLKVIILKLLHKLKEQGFIFPEISGKADSKDIKAEARNIKIDTNSPGPDTKNFGFDTNNSGFDTNNLGFDINSLGFDTNNLGFDINSLGLDTINFSLDTKSLGLDTKSLSFDTKSLSFDTKSLSFDTNKSGFDTNRSGVDTNSLNSDTNNPKPEVNSVQTSQEAFMLKVKPVLQMLIRSKVSPTAVNRGQRDRLLREILFFNEKGNVTADEMQSHFKAARLSVHRDIKMLKDLGFIKYKKRSRPIHWELSKTVADQILSVKS